LHSRIKTSVFVNPFYEACKGTHRRLIVNLRFFLKGLVTGKSSRDQELPASDPATESSNSPHQLNGGLDSAQQFNERGLAQMDNGRFDEAVASFARAIELQHDFADAHHNLGRAYLAMGHAEDAVDCFYLATHFAPTMAMAHLNLGTALSALCKNGEAMAALHRALELDPGLADAHLRLASLFKSGGGLEQAVTHYRRAVELLPDSAEVHCNLGYALFKLDRFDDAEAHYMTALRNKKDFAEAHHNLGLLFFQRGEPERALACLETALALKPRLPETVSCIGHALRDLGRYDEALARYDEALTIRPDFGDAVINRCYIYLALGNYEHGWREYERRFAATDTAKRNFPYPVWCGEDLAGKSILVWGEQGIGDQIWFASLLPDLIARAVRCIYECSAKLVPLFARSFPHALIVPRTDPPHPATQHGIDYQIAAGSVARWLRPTLASFPNRPGYLVADPQRVAYWRERFAEIGGGLKVGFCWRSGNQTGKRALEYTSILQWGPIFAVPGVHFVNLQYDECMAELDRARSEFGVTLHHFPEVDRFDDLDETAALMKALDLVISAPTAVSAQAAALGLSCWQMSSGQDWSALGTEHTPWHPTMKCFRRTWEQPWPVIIEQIASELHRVARAHG
jgi:tetratricopeptide (TPR) repeat protein